MIKSDIAWLWDD